MELELNSQHLEFFETVVDTTLYQEETAESIVPDSCPDIARVVSVSGIPCLTERMVQDGRGELAGQVKTTLLYRPEGAGSLRRIEVPVPFRCTISGAGISSTAKIVAIPRLQAADARVLNPRKILIRVNLAIGVQIFTPQVQRFCSSIGCNENAGIEQLEERCATYFAADIQEKNFTFSDELPIGGRGGVEELLDQFVDFHCNESKIIGNKLIFKGDADLHLLYRVGDSMEGADYKLPFSQILEVAELGETTDCALEFQLTGLECARGGDNGNLVYVTFEVLAQSVIWEQREWTIIRDFYSTSAQSEAEYCPCQFYQRLGEESDHQSIRELIETERAVKTVLDTSLKLGAVTRSREGGQVLLSTAANLQILYLGEDDEFYSASHQVTVNSRFDCPEDGACMAQCFSEGDVFATPVSGGVEVRFAVSFRALLASRRSMVILKAGKLKAWDESGQNEVRPSIVLRQMEGDESLWDVAKSCGTTRAVILSANKLENESDCRGHMLLIPRVR